MLFEKTTYEDDFPIRICILRITEYPLHYHQDHELIYILKGSVQLKNGSGTYLLREGDVFTNSGHEVHGLKAAEEDNAAAVIQISNQFFAQYFPELGKACFRTYVNNDKYRRLDALRKMLLDILYNYTRRSFSYKSTCITQMIDVIAYLKRYFNLFAFEDQVVVNFKNDNPVILTRISHIINFIYENHRDKITLQTLAEREHLSTFYLSHLIREHMGISFQELLCFARVEMSEIPLLETDHKISTIARDCGFSATSYYCKYFVKWFGHTPQVHRELYASDILGAEVSARYALLSENETVRLLRLLLSAWKDREGSAAPIRRLQCRAVIAPDAIPIRSLAPESDIRITCEDHVLFGETLFSLLDELQPASVTLSVSAGDSEEEILRLRNRLFALGFRVSEIRENSLQPAVSCGYDTIAYALCMLRSCLLSGQDRISCRLRDPGSRSAALKGAPACMTADLLPKPAFYALRLLQSMKGDLLYQDSHCCIIRSDAAPETWILVLFHASQEILHLCSRSVGAHEAGDVISAFRDELQVDLSLPLSPGNYAVIQTALSNADSVFSCLEQLGFPESFCIPHTLRYLFRTQPRTQLRTETVKESMHIRASLSGAGIQVVILRKMDNTCRE